MGKYIAILYSDMKPKIVKFYISSCDIKKCKGDRAALLYSHLRYWIRVNAQKRIQIDDSGFAWRYFSYRSLHNEVRHLSVSTIKRLIGHLKKQGVLVIKPYVGGPGGHSLMARLRTHSVQNVLPGTSKRTRARST